MKITTEKLPNSLLSLQIELDKDRLEKGLDQAARRLSQKYPIHGFRPGKAPRFIIERTFGREMLIEEASEDLINKAFRDALKQVNIEPVGPASFQGISSSDPFIFTVHVPIPPTVDIGDYRAIRVPLDIEPVTDEAVAQAMEMIRERHAVLKELEEPRPVQEGDQIRVRLETIVDGKPLEERTEDGNPPEQTLVVAKGRLVDELFNGLIGMQVGDTKAIVAQMPADHPNEQVRGKTVTFNVEILNIQQRLLPEWEELPSLENFEGTLDDLRAKTRAELERHARDIAERKVLDAYIERLVAQTSFDIPEVMIRDQAKRLFEEQVRQFSRYGVTQEQLLKYRGQTLDQALDALMPDAERQTKINLALREVIRREGLSASDAEIEYEIGRLALDYAEDQRDNVTRLLQSQLRPTIAGMVIDRKLRERLIAIAAGTAPDPAAEAPVAASDEATAHSADHDPASEAEAAASTDTPASDAPAPQAASPSEAAP